ncbi:ATP-binding protein, partial [Butyricicoccus sp. 1XD8-22]
QLNFIGDPKPVAITENALAQIARNIIENGIRYNDKNPIIQVQVNFLTENTFLTIKDNGIGISQNNIQKIFDRFFRVDDSREAVGGGTGLGLSITKMLADKYDIEMDVSSEIGEGT